MKKLNDNYFLTFKQFQLLKEEFEQTGTIAIGEQDKDGNIICPPLDGLDTLNQNVDSEIEKAFQIKDELRKRQKLTEIFMNYVKLTKTEDEILNKAKNISSQLEKVLTSLPEQITKNLDVVYRNFEQKGKNATDTISKFIIEFEKNLSLPQSGNLFNALQNDDDKYKQREISKALNELKNNLDNQYFKSHNTPLKQLDYLSDIFYRKIFKNVLNIHELSPLFNSSALKNKFWEVKQYIFDLVFAYVFSKYQNVAPNYTEVTKPTDVINYSKENNGLNMLADGFTLEYGDYYRIDIDYNKYAPKIAQAFYNNLPADVASAVLGTKRYDNMNYTNQYNKQPDKNFAPDTKEKQNP